MEYPLIKGIVIGFLIAAPVGPVGILCIHRALADGRGAAFVAGLGAAVADTLYGAVAGLGITLVKDFLLEHRVLLSVVGSIFLLGLGLHTFRAAVRYDDDESVHPGLLRDFGSTFVITLTNPGTILAFMGTFAAVGAVKFGGHEIDAGLLVAGVFLGSSAWWFLLSAVAASVRERFKPHWLVYLNKGSGVVLALFGVGVLISSFL